MKIKMNKSHVSENSDDLELDWWYEENFISH